jgi:hypothetical protein
MNTIQNVGLRNGNRLNTARCQRLETRLATAELPYRVDWIWYGINYRSRSIEGSPDARDSDAKLLQVLVR